MKLTFLDCLAIGFIPFVWLLTQLFGVPQRFGFYLLNVLALIGVIKHSFVAVSSFRKKDYSKMKVSLFLVFITILTLIALLWLMGSIFK